MPGEHITGHELAAATEGYIPYFQVDPEAVYIPVEFENPGTSNMIGRHYASVSHIMTDEAAYWVGQVGRGVGDKRRPQYAVFLSADRPPQAQLYERIDP